MNNKKALKVLVFIFLALVMCSPSFAEETGSISKDAFTVGDQAFPLGLEHQKYFNVDEVALTFNFVATDTDFPIEKERAISIACDQIKKYLKDGRKFTIAGCDGVQFSHNDPLMVNLYISDLRKRNIDQNCTVFAIEARSLRMNPTRGFSDVNSHGDQFSAFVNCGDQKIFEEDYRRTISKTAGILVKAVRDAGVAK